MVELSRTLLNLYVKIYCGHHEDTTFLDFMLEDSIGSDKDIVITPYWSGDAASPLHMLTPCKLPVDVCLFFFHLLILSFITSSLYCVFLLCNSGYN